MPQVVKSLRYRPQPVNIAMGYRTKDDYYALIKGALTAQPICSSHHL
jgi:hypothetical protein